MLKLIIVFAIYHIYNQMMIRTGLPVILIGIILGGNY